MNQTVYARVGLCKNGRTCDLISAVVICGLQCRAGDTVTITYAFPCQCHFTNVAYRTLQFYYFCKKDERVKPCSFQAGNGLLDLEEHSTAKWLYVVVVFVVCFIELTGVVWSRSHAA